MPASIGNASDGAIGRMPNSSPAHDRVPQSVPRVPSRKVDLESRTGGHPVRLIGTRMPSDLEALRQ
jgi:hypothetical protein